jgi:hypothetical protein
MFGSHNISMQMHHALFGIALLGVMTGCVTAPPPTEVVMLRATDLPQDAGLPPAGTTWRLDESDLKTLSPAPYVPPPPLMLPYPIPGVAPPPPVYAPDGFDPVPPLIYFGLGFGWGDHGHSHAHPRSSRPRRR